MTAIPEKIQKSYGLLPEGWRLEKLKFFADVRNSNVDKTIVEDEEPVRLCNYTDVYYNDRITSDIDFMNGSATKAEIEKFQLKRDQVIITKDSEGWDDIGIPALVTEDMPDVLCGYHLSVLEPGAQLDGGFLAWLCRSEPLNDQFKLGANGVTRYGLGQYPMKNSFIALPPLETQRRIAQFLDEKTARIDGLIEKKRALLDRLAEKRQALITRAVTRGISDLVHDKDDDTESAETLERGIWESWKLAHAYPRIGSGTTPTSTSDHYYSTEGGTPWITTAELRENYIDKTASNVTNDALREYSTLRVYKPGSLFIAMYGATIGRLGISTVPATCNQACCVFEESKVLDNRFLFYWLWHRRADLISLSVGGGQPNLSQQDLREERAYCPPLKIQRRIVQFLDEMNAGMDKQEEGIERSIALLNEYRSALITAAVTGVIGGLQ